MFILQAFKPENRFWKYLVGSLILIVASTIGQIPLGIALMVKSLKEGVTMPTDEAGMLRFMDLNLTLFLVLFSFVIALITLGIVVRQIHRQKFREVVTARPKIDRRRIFFAFIIWAVFSIATVLLTYFSEPGKYVMQFDPVKFTILFIIAVLMVPIQTSVEELVFRGYLMQGFGLLAKNRWFPLVMTSVIFGAMHLFNPEVAKMGYIITVYYIGTGLLLGIMTLMDDGTELALGFHAANNLTAALLVTADWTAFQTNSVFKDISEPQVGFDVLLPVFIIYPILLFIFSKKYKWSGWKEKLTGNLHMPAQVSINEIGQDND